MACTLFSRGETGWVRAGELFMLWAMVHQHPVNICYYLVNNLASVAGRGKGLIACGGMVSFNEHKLELHNKLDGVDKVEGGWGTDLDYCVTYKMIERVSAGAYRFYLLIARQRSIRLPDLARTDTRNPNNWLYPIDLRRKHLVLNEEVLEEEEMVGQDDQNADPTSDFNMQKWCARIEVEQARHEVALQQMREDHIL